jgi:hypothetical protein
MNKSLIFAAVVFLFSSTLLSQDSITVDLSQMKGSPVAMVAEPITNKLVLYSACATNGISSRSVLSVDGVVKQIREQGDMTNLVKKLAASGDVCSVIGHKWQYGCGEPGCLVSHTVPTRYCLVCGKIQTQEVSNWK